MKQFRNDYSELAHEEILKAVLELSNEQNVGYGLDKHSINAEKLILEKFKVENGSVFFVTGGTQANLLVLSYILKPYEGVICCDSGHINVHETAAVEGSGHKIITVPNKNGKLTKEGLTNAFLKCVDEHMVKPKCVYISDSTETGTIYSKKELSDLRKACDKYNLYLFLDGARLGSALTSSKNDVTCDFIGKICDIFYVGGTKNGMMSGEAIVFKNKELANEFRYHIKNRGAMLSKGFVVAAQFERAFKDNLYFEIAKNSNKMAEYIKKNLKKLVIFTSESPTNQLFIKVNKVLANKLIKSFGLELWEDLGQEKIVRVVTSFRTTKEDCDELISFIKKYGN